jgi:NADH pyrophosphatase NudC (nudix superfamily)
MGYSYDGADLREHPEEYRIGRGEQGVFHAEPYKGELLPLWKFKDEEAARESSKAIYRKFLEYRSEGDFVGMDVARKYLQMGWTRSLRYAKYKGGKKSQPFEEPDREKLRCASIFKELYDRARTDQEYVGMKEEHRRRNE